MAFPRAAAAAGSGEPARRRQVLGPQEGGIEQLALVPGAVVAEDGRDGVAGPQLAGEADGAGDIDAGGAADAEALVLQQVEDQRQRLLVGDLAGEIDGRALDVLGDAALADPLGDRGALDLDLVPGEPVIVGRAERIGEADLDPRIALLEEGAGAPEGAARS